MKKIIGIITILLITSSVFGQRTGGGICEFFNKPFTERYQFFSPNITFSFKTNGKTFMLSYDVDCKVHNNYSTSPDVLVKRNIYLHRLDDDGWKIASDLVKTDYWNTDEERAYDMYLDTRRDLTELIGDTTQASVEVYDNGMVKMKFLSFYSYKRADNKWHWRWDEVLFIPNGDETYSVKSVPINTLTKLDSYEPVRKNELIKKEEDKTNTSQMPPILTISNISYSDINNNNCIDGNEKCFINFLISNKGKGSAKNIKVLVQNYSDVSGLDCGSAVLETIAPNSTQNVKIPITGTMNLTSGIANIKISFIENMGFPPDPFELNIETKEFIKPNIRIVDYSFISEDGIIKLGSPVQLKILIQNIGQGIGENIIVGIQYPNSNVFPNGQKEFEIGNLQAGETKELIFEFIPNKLYGGKTIPITNIIKEKYGLFGENKQLLANIDSKTSSTTINIASNTTKNIEKNIQIASLRADVDVNIPVNSQINDKTFVVIIANENYSREVNVEFANNDGKVFKEYCEKTFGIPSKNIHFSKDATFGTMRSEINWINDVAEAYNGEAKIIFYYAGHGMPNEADKSAYLLPVDGFSSDYETAIKVEKLYNKLSQYPTQGVTVFLDACFSGSVRDNGMLAIARGVKIKPKQTQLKEKMIVFTAATGDETAFPYKEKQHGLFTYFLLKKLQETKGDVDYQTLSNYIIENVKRQSIVVNQKFQTPQILAAPEIQNSWRLMKIK